MNQRALEIEHVLQHYIHRDLFRVAAHEHLSRNPRQRGLWLPISFLKYNQINPDGHEIQASVVHGTREALKRAKMATIRHLHDRLHEEPMLSDHEHVHDNGEIFTFVIHENELL